MQDSSAETPAYRTLDGPAEAELVVRRSRFLARIEPAADDDQARRMIAACRERHHDARHVCHAWRLGHDGPPSEQRADAGEPSGSAGEPILNVLRRADLTDVVATVVRWFGGIKLGTGGLSRAYRDAAAAALDRARIREVRIGREFTLHLPYKLQKTLNRLLDEFEGRLLEERFGADIQWRVWLPAGREEGFAAAVESASLGTVALDDPD